MNFGDHGMPGKYRVTLRRWKRTRQRLPRR
jgi:hypothetical protein